jgi:hypothetical protein
MARSANFGPSAPTEGAARMMIACKFDLRKLRMQSLLFCFVGINLQITGPRPDVRFQVIVMLSAQSTGACSCGIYKRAAAQIVIERVM